MRRAIGSGWWPRTWRVLATVCVLTVALPSRPFAHEIPPSVALVAFVKPETGRLRLLVRVPLEAIRDVDFPQRGAGYLDIARTTPLLRDAANVWIADYVEMYENDRRLERGGIVATRVSLPSDRAFATYDGALATVTGPPLADSVALPWQQRPAWLSANPRHLTSRVAGRSARRPKKRIRERTASPPVRTSAARRREEGIGNWDSGDGQDCDLFSLSAQPERRTSP